MKCLFSDSKACRTESGMLDGIYHLLPYQLKLMQQIYLSYTKTLRGLKVQGYGREIEVKFNNQFKGQHLHSVRHG